jgi:hypothetical protein
MSFKAIAICAVLGVPALIGGQASAAGIANGDFSSGLSGWTASGTVHPADGAIYNACCGTPIETTPMFAAFGWGNVADTNTLSQTFSTIAGRTYVVSFGSGALGGGSETLSYALSGGGTNAGNILEHADNSLITTFSTTTFSFKSTGGPTTLTFTNDSILNDGVDPVLTNVSVASVPEPATWAVMLCGVGMIGAALRDKRRSRAALAKA